VMVVVAQKEPARGRTTSAVRTDKEASARLDSLQAELLHQFQERKALHQKLLEKLEAESRERGEEQQTSTKSVDAPFKSTPPPRPANSPIQPPKRSTVFSSPSKAAMPTLKPDPMLPKIKNLEPPSFSSSPEVVEVVSPPKEAGPPLAGDNVTNLVFVASECAPWSKTGGLGDVVGALPKSMADRGHRVMVVVPRYANYPEAFDTGVRWSFPVFGSDQEVGYFHAYVDGVDYVFVDHGCYHNVADAIYTGSGDELNFRFSLLCRAALEAVWHVPFGGFAYGDNNTVFVANDWQTCLLPVYLQAYYRDHGKMLGARSIMVIHNMAHQGRGPLTLLGDLGIPEHYKELFRLKDPVGGEGMNIMKAGLSCAHRLVAVSHGYAWEVQTDEGGWGLASWIRDQSWKLRGIVNGIDYEEWNPMKDEYIQSDGYENYDATKEGIRKGKAACKAALQRELGLPEEPDTPMLGFIGRLDQQKGVDQIFEAQGWLMEQRVQLVMLGTGRHDLEEQMRHIENNNRDRVRAWVGFSVKMAHRINASCDILLMPSRFEPCGLNQLYAMRYGTVPVVHAVGGLRDTVEPYMPFENTGTGWNYEGATKDNLIGATYNAISTYRDFRDSFVGIQLRGMKKNATWDHAAELYEAAIVDAKYDDYRG